MAVKLKDDGRYPASQKIPPEQFLQFVENCRNAPQPSEKMMAALLSAAKHKVACR